VVGGQLKVGKEGENKIDTKSTKKVQERRVAQKKKQTSFRKEARFRLKNTNSFVAGFVRQSLLVATPQVAARDLDDDSSDKVWRTYK
jgi:hypothetical protein